MDDKINNDLIKPVVQITNQTGGFHYIYVTSLIYVLSIYMMPVLFLIGSSNTTFYFFLIPFGLGIVNIIVSIMCGRTENRIVLLNAAVLIKYSLIPFFMIGGCLIVVTFLFSFIPVPFMIFVGPMVALLEAGVGWFALALGAPYTISYLCVSAKEKLRPKSMVVIHSILQFFFVVDVIDLMVLTLKERKWRKLTITIIILMAIFALLMLILLILGITGSITHGS
ncbi:MAG: hypothetical protein K2L07_05575 [Lachnospiraceae bacterium]|nr:hypothetical protein [Lachnospiraceae bacterium]